MIQPVYNGFDDFEDLCDKWQGSERWLEDAEVLLALYDVANYEGYAYCLYRKGGELFEVTDSHCSCSGLIEFVPTAVNLEYLKSNSPFRFEKEHAEIVRQLVIESAKPDLDSPSEVKPRPLYSVPELRAAIESADRILARVRLSPGGEIRNLHISKKEAKFMLRTLRASDLTFYEVRNSVEGELLFLGFPE